MIALHELQTAVGRSITSEAPLALLGFITGDASEASARLSIYRNNVLSRLAKSLRETFPVVCRLVDERFFDYAAHAYIRTALPTEGCLADYGGTFPAFLAAFPAASEIPYLPDVATLEWSIHRAQRASPLPTLPLAALADEEGDPAMVRLRVAPWLGYVSSRYNVDQIWAAHGPEGLPGGLQVESMNLPLQVYGLDGLSLSRLAPATWVFRSSLARGDTLGEATEITIGTFPQFDLAADLSALFRDGCVVGLETASGVRGITRGGGQQSRPSGAGVSW
jgi:hypothetical protein